MMRINNLEIHVFQDSQKVELTKHYNAAVKTEISLDVDDIYALEFAVKEIKRALKLDEYKD